MQSATDSPLTRMPPGSRWGVFGLGQTGASCASFLARRGFAVLAMDTRDAPPDLARVHREAPNAEVHYGELPTTLLAGLQALVVSPGLPLDHPLITTARVQNIPVFGDIELFARHADAPVIGITGSNGKSTVTTLVAEILAQAGKTVRAGANLGTPALDLLNGKRPDCYVLELSSFQLDLTDKLELEVGCILNITADHLDRHGSFAAYRAAKARILRHARAVVLNEEDPQVASLARPEISTSWVSTGISRHAGYGVREIKGERALCNDDREVLPADRLRLNGTHNEFNALAAIAITDRFNIPREVQCRVLTSFEGLAHRCRLVADQHGIAWFNDSKGTNVGATVAAITGIFGRRGGVLIAGGQGKGADFTALRDAVKNRIHTVVLIGEDAPKIAAAINDLVRIVPADSMVDAVTRAGSVARPGDAVLLSPACASFDMFKNYMARGHAFESAVRALVYP